MTILCLEGASAVGKTTVCSRRNFDKHLQLAVTQHNASARLFEAMAALAQGVHPSPHGRLP